VRLGLRVVRGFANAPAAAILAARADRPFASLDDLWRQAGAPAAALVRLAEADAFRSALTWSAPIIPGRSAPIALRVGDYLASQMRDNSCTRSRMVGLTRI
jgi:hypothetical protein